MNRLFKLLGTFSLILMLTMTRYASADEATGTVKSVDAAKNEVVLKGLIKDATYQVKNDANVCLDGVKSKLGDLKEGDHVTVTYEKQGEQMTANEVRGLHTAKEVTGTVRSIFAEKNEIVIKGTVKDTTYELNKGGIVWINGKESALANIHDGDQALITYQQRGDHLMAISVRLARK